MNGTQIPAKSARDIAKEHIDSISARLKRILTDEEAGDLIERMLHFFGEDIYSTPTHFILELIQNADDAKYTEESTPTLDLTYRHNRLCTDCNELGFTRENVDAICKIGRSTKKNQVGSTGEKGVGFKSVFGVAGCVWIASNDYTFKFDSSNPMGMLIPIWEDPPVGARRTNSSMYFQLRPGIDERRVFSGLHHLGGKVLIFLHKLRRIQLHIEPESGDKVCYNVEREDLTSSDGLLMTRLRFSGEEFSTPHMKDYLVCHYRISDMPGETKRPGRSKSDIKLAFLVNELGQPVLESQDVYAFLPVRSYGFTFLLQGDFLLSTSREEISSSREWNAKICESLPDAFTAAVKTIVAHRREFPWFRFLPNESYEESLFQEAKKRIPRRVAEEQVLLCEGLDENSQGLLAIPSSLRYIPREFRDSNGVPLTLCIDTRDQYLSTKYSHDDWGFLQRLGVQQMSSKEFMDDLDQLVENHGVQDKPAEWHRSLARAVNELARNSGGKNVRSTLCKLAILPLQGNEWVSSTKCAVFFPPIPGNVPRGLAIFEISQDAMDGGLRSDRAIFFEHAGAQRYNHDIVCDLIVVRQMVTTILWQPNRRPSGLGDNRVSDLAKQLYFLYTQHWTDKKRNRTLWVLSEQNEPRQASAVYIQSREPDSAAVMLQGISTTELLHKDYLSVVGGDRSEFIEWLRLTFGIWRIPRLADRSNKLSPDFRHVIDTTPSPFWLRLLGKYYNQYSVWLDPRATKAQAVLESLRSEEVECLNNEKAILAKTCRPKLEKFLKEKCLVLDPEFKEWSLLKDLGVIVEMNLSFYFEKLESLRTKRLKPSEAEIRQLYSHIQDQSEGSGKVIREAFENDRLIYMPSLELGAPDSWLTPGEGCIWKGPKSLRHTPKLQELYPDNELLFKEILKIRDAGPDLLLQEIAERKPTLLPDILELLQDADSLWAGVNAFTLNLMKGWKIFPVREPSDPNGFALMSESDIWRIPDERLRTLFCKKLPLLAFTYDALSDMPNIRIKFGLDSHKLMVTNTTFYEDTNPRLRSPTTAEFRDRIKLMSRLIPKEMPNMSKRMAKLFTAQLYSVDAIFSAFTAEHGGRTITAEKLKGECLLTDEEDDLKIYLTKSCIDRQIFPSELADQLSQLYSISERALAQDTLTQNPDYVREKLTNIGYTKDMEYQPPQKERDIGGGRPTPSKANGTTSAMHPEAIRAGDQHRPEALSGWKAKGRTTSGTPATKKRHEGSRPVSGQSQKVSSSGPKSTPIETQPEEQTDCMAESSLRPAGDVVPRSRLENAAVSASGQVLEPSNEIEEVVFEGDGDVHCDDEMNEYMGEPANVQDEPMELKGSNTEILQDSIMPSPESNQGGQQQDSRAKSTGEIILLQIQDRQPETSRDLWFSGGMNEDQIFSLYRQYVDVVEEKFMPDIPKRKEKRQQAEVTAKPQPVEKLPLAAGEVRRSNLLEDPQPKTLQPSGHSPQEKLALPRQQINETDASREQQPLKETREMRRSHGLSRRAHVVASPISKLSVIEIPDFPKDSLRDFLQNRVKHKVRRAPAEIIFLPVDGDSSGADSHVNIDRNIRTHPGRVHIDEVTGAKTVFVALPNHLQQEETFLGEFLISRLLEREMKEFYAPETHWTSPRRYRAGYRSYKSQDDPKSPHTAFLLNKSSIFTAYLVRHGCDHAKRWIDKSITYHLDVQVTSGDLDAPFQVHHENFEMAQVASIDDAESTDVYVLFRVHSIYSSPKIAIFVNIWSLYVIGKLHLTLKGDHYVAKLIDAVTETPTLSLVGSEPEGCYEYRPLESKRHIRLFKISAIKDQETLQGSILHTSLDANPSFIALSYTWGPVLKPYRIRTAEGDIPVTASLYHAIKRMRQTEDFINIWADGISINQSDGAEKSEQISLLPDVYCQATHVWGWVGDEANDSNLAMKALRDINNSSDVLPRLNENVQAALIEFFARPWFVRSWIIQEVTLARDLQIVCGSEKLSWERLYDAVRKSEAYAKRSVEHLQIPATRNLGPILSLGKNRQMYQEGKKHGLLDLFELFQHAKSTLRRDRLFTLLNIAADREGFCTDYNSPLESIVCKYASKFVASGKALQLLYRARGSTGSSRFPSWIPDWTASRYPKTISMWPSQQQFHASGDSTAEIRVDPDTDRILLVDGCIVCKIVKVGNCPFEIDKAIDYIREILDFIGSSKSDYPIECRKDSLKFQIPIGNAIKEPMRNQEDLKRSFQLFEQLLKLREAMISKETVDIGNLHKDLWLYYLTVVEFSELIGSAVVCRTEGGYIGLVPASAKEGDAIALVSGAKVPFCLRHGQGEDMYQLLGEAYIHGVMNGEAFNKEDIKTLRFC